MIKQIVSSVLLTSCIFNINGFFNQINFLEAKKNICKTETVLPLLVGSFITYKLAVIYKRNTEFSNQSNIQLLITTNDIIEKLIQKYQRMLNHVATTQKQIIDIDILSDVTLKAQQKGRYIFASYKYDQDIELDIDTLSRLAAELTVRSINGSINRTQLYFYINLTKDLVTYLDLLRSHVQYTNSYQTEKATSDLIHACAYTLALLGSTFIALYYSIINF